MMSSNSIGGLIWMVVSKVGIECIEDNIYNRLVTEGDW